jgi:hypothetical protein
MVTVKRYGYQKENIKLFFNIQIETPEGLILAIYHKQKELRQMQLVLSRWLK